MKTYLAEIKITKTWTPKHTMQSDYEMEEDEVRRAFEKHGDVLIFDPSLYYFKLGDKIYEVTIGHDNGDIFFDTTDGVYDLTGDGAYKILARVIAAVKDHHKRTGRKNYKFLALKEPDEHVKELSTRGKLYKDAIKSIVPGAKITTTNDGFSDDEPYVHFTLP